MNIIKRAFRFSGRARRREWWVSGIVGFLFLLLGVFVSSIFDRLRFGALGMFEVIFGMSWLTIIVAELAVCWRRMHDTGKSGWYSLIPFYGGFVMGFVGSQKGANKYGPNPKDEGRKPEESPPLSEPTAEGGTNRAFYGFVIAIVVLAGAMYYTAFYEPQSGVSQGVSREMVKRWETQGGVNARDEKGRTPLMFAARDGNTEAIRKLLKAGANIEARDNKPGGTALIVAAGNGQTEAIRVLLDAGADIEARDNVGWTALMWAAKNGQTGVIRELVKAGADIEARNNDGGTVLVAAVANGQLGAIRMLMKAGADIEARGDTGGTVLMVAVVNGQTETIRELVKAGADVNARSNTGKTALMWAAGEGQTEAIRELVKTGADVNARSNTGWTALMWAALKGQTEAIRELVNAGANKRARSDSDNTALYIWQSEYKHHPNFWQISDLLRP